MADSHYAAELCLTDVEDPRLTRLFFLHGDRRTAVQEEQRVLTPEPEAKM